MQNTSTDSKRLVDDSSIYLFALMELVCMHVANGWDDLGDADEKSDIKVVGINLLFPFSMQINSASSSLCGSSATAHLKRHARRF